MEVEWIFEVIDRFEQAQQAELSSKCESGFRSPPWSKTQAEETGRMASAKE